MFVCLDFLQIYQIWSIVVRQSAAGARRRLFRRPCRRARFEQAQKARTFQHL